MATSDSVSDYRVDPFTGVEFPVNIPEEFHTITADPVFGWPSVHLREAPYRRAGEPLANWISILAWDGADYTIPYTVIEPSLTPSAGEYRVSFDPSGAGPRSICQFNGANLGVDIKVNYYGLGSMVDSNNYSGVPVGSMLIHFINAGGASVATMRNFGYMIPNGDTPADQGISGAKWVGPSPELYAEVSPGVWEYRYLAAGPEGLVGTIEQWGIPFHAHDNDSHTHTISDPGHGHGITDPGHDHDITPNSVDLAPNTGVRNQTIGALISSPPQTTSTETTGIGIINNSTGVTANSSTINITEPITLAGQIDLTGRILQKVRPDTIYYIPMLRVK